MRVTIKQLEEAAQLLTETTGREYKVAPFPAPRGGWNLLRNDGNGFNVIKGGRKAKELHDWIQTYVEGFRAGIDKANAEH